MDKSAAADTAEGKVKFLVTGSRQSINRVKAILEAKIAGKATAPPAESTVDEQAMDMSDTTAQGTEEMDVSESTVETQERDER